MKRLVLLAAVLVALYALDLFMFRGMYFMTASRIANEFFRRMF